MINDSTDILSPITETLPTSTNRQLHLSMNLSFINLPNLPEIRSKQRSTSPNPVDSPTRHFEIPCHNILDTAVQSINRRCSGHKDLHKEISLAQLA